MCAVVHVPYATHLAHAGSTIFLTANMTGSAAHSCAVPHAGCPSHSGRCVWGGGSGTANDASQCAVPLLTAPGVAGTRAVSVTVRPQMLCGEGVLPLLPLLPLLLLRPIILSACLPAGTYWHKLQLQLPCLL